MDNVYRNFKDNVFCLLHREKGHLLELYNGMNGTDHSDADGLDVVTLANAICIRYRNDAAYTFNNNLYLYEQLQLTAHQTSRSWVSTPLFTEGKFITLTIKRRADICLPFLCAGAHKEISCCRNMRPA